MRRTPRAAASRVATLIRHLAEARISALVLYAAGKDRTGFVSAVLLAALGVGSEVIDALQARLLEWNRFSMKQTPSGTA